MKLKKLPIGVENFADFFQEDFYYVDKTMLISELLNNGGVVNLFTRPRRFGKSLNMSMLKHFFEIGCEKSLFDGLKISDEKELCESYMGQFPVVSITLKGVDGLNYKNAYTALSNRMGEEACRFKFLLDSSHLNDSDKERYCSLMRLENGLFLMEPDLLMTSLQLLTQLLTKHYGKKTILLIDEYDVPLDKAFQNGYYDEMAALIRGLLGNALKTNDSLNFAVLTGCLRISKESIFTGLNNLSVRSITDEIYDEYFGFTDAEVREILRYYDREEAFGTMKQWYNGYRFGNSSIYCPWDVINYSQALLKNKNARPRNYWANTSGNDLVRRFIDKADKRTKDEIEQLIAGDVVIKTIDMELTYNELDSSIDNLWSVLFATGYLTMREELEENRFELVIPNQEIRSLFISQIRVWFREAARENPLKLEKLCRAFPAGDAETVEKLLNEYLWDAISIRDTFVQKEKKENFYHGMLLGLLQYMENWSVRSNEESGEGFSDIRIETPELIGVVIEVKYAENSAFEKGCQEALDQIERKQYAARLKQDHMETIVKYGIAFYKKRCRVVLGE